MQPTRRRKKRPNYGIRTVEVCRGKNGFGFTISGQQPCILSCIVPNSPAEQAGLRPGDYLIAVCGQNVSKTPHDDVVQLIGNCHGILKLQIAENYYSDSSEEDFITTVRQKPKYPHKTRNSGHNSHPLLYKSKCAGIDEYSSFTDGFDFSKINEPLFSAAAAVASVKNESMALSRDMNANHVLPETNYIIQSIVGYLGTIEMPRKLTPVSRPQVVRDCIKRLRAEKRNHNPVIMTVFPCSLRLKNESGTTIAVYPGGRVTFCSTNNEQNKKYFGIVTTSVCEEPSNSCHVFATLNSVHAEHSKVAARFGVNCVSSSDSGAACSYFPANCDVIVDAIRKYYEVHLNGMQEEPLLANSPQPSNDSSVTTSNSDSGIGFRDESGHQSDRILVVDIQNQRLHIQAAGQPDAQCIDCYADKSDSRNSTIKKLSPFANNENQPRNYDDQSVNGMHWNAAKHQMNNKVFHKSCEDNLPSSFGGLGESLERKLSPKVFNNMNEFMLVSQSLEDLKTQSELYEDLEPPDNFMKKHSLQDLTVFSADHVSEEKPQQCEPTECERKVTSWATSLEKLLYDNAGLHAFAEFLKKEFSVENAYFWAACEKYRRTTTLEERKKQAQDIYDKFLSNAAIEPVNVDSSGKNLSQQQIQTADLNLFQNSQKQIFNLMKFDSYPRFLKSDIYKSYLVREIAGENINLLPEMLDADLQCSPTRVPLVNKENIEEDLDRNQRTSRRRRSLLMWTKSRCKSRDRMATGASNENVSSRSSSHTSLASWDLALPASLCRVTLPDASSAVLNVQPQQSVHYLISKLMEKRAMLYTSFQVIMMATDKVIDLEDNASALAGKEVRIEWRVEFRLDLPDRKSLTIKSKPTHSLGAVLGPVLIKHGYNLQMVTLCLMSENEVLEPSTLVSAVDKQRVQVLTRSTPTPNLQGWNYYGASVKSRQPSTLDEITNRVFEELLQGKAENFKHPVAESAPSTHSEDWSSEHSSKLLGKFLRKDSIIQDKHKRSKKHSEGQNNSEKKSINNRLPPVIAKWKPVVARLDTRFEKDGLYEGLKRCQRGRLEDQRGTEIKTELPDFLKDKENAPEGRKKLKKIRKDTQTLVEKETKDTMSMVGVTVSCAENVEPLSNKSNNGDLYQRPIDCKYEEEPEEIYANDILNFAYKSTASSSDTNTVPPLFKEPPPLPPKPKNISWRVTNGLRYNFDASPKSVYLDQPSSSFV